MSTIFNRIFSPAARPAPSQAPVSTQGTQGRTPLTIRSAAGKLGARLRAAFTGKAAPTPPREQTPAAPARALASRPVQVGWQPGQRPSQRREMTLERARKQLRAGPVELEAPPGHAAPLTPVAFALSTRRDELQAREGSQLEDLDGPASTAATRHEGLPPEFVSVSSDREWEGREAGRSGVNSTWTPPATSGLDDALAGFDEALGGGWASTTVSPDGALLDDLTRDDGEGLSRDAAHAVIDRMSKGASREDALDDLREGKLGVPEYATHASIGTGGWGSDD